MPKPKKTRTSRDVPCPICGAKSGAPCRDRTVSGRLGRVRAISHPSRSTAWRRKHLAKARVVHAARTRVAEVAANEAWSRANDPDPEVAARGLIDVHARGGAIPGAVVVRVLFGLLAKLGEPV